MNLKYVNYFHKPTTRINFQFRKFHLIPKIEIKVNVLILKIELNTKWKSTIGRKFSTRGREGSKISKKWVTSFMDSSYDQRLLKNSPKSLLHYNFPLQCRDKNRKNSATNFFLSR